MVFLHGKMHMTIEQAELVAPRLPSYCFLCNAAAHALEGEIDPFVDVVIEHHILLRTKTRNENANPRWGESAVADVCHEMEEVLVKVLDEDVTTHTQISAISFSAEELLAGKRFEGWMELGAPYNSKHRQGHHGRINMSLWFEPISQLQLGESVPGTYFDAWQGCRVTLYQDAHQEPNSLPALQLGNGATFEHRPCWEDIAASIERAQKFIYIAGWSVATNIRLVRKEGAPTVGQLLKAKANQGVRVVLLVWDDATSFESPFYVKGPGVMGTLDEETRKEFQGTAVKCFLVSKNLILADSRIGSRLLGVTFTHHQKSVVVDADPIGAAQAGKRSILAYMGGLDIAEGRWDTKDHPLFRTLNTVHKEDFIQHNAKGISSELGPRQPWQDVHCRIEGPATRDIMRNFEERLRKLDPKSAADLLYPVAPEEFELHGEAKLPMAPAEDWTVQLFRSIDDVNCDFDQNLLGAPRTMHFNGHHFEMSIQQAYVHHIRRAKRFIYIENQYFLGSAFAWAKRRNTICNNMVPVEIAQKICNKIREGRRFTAYIVVPMFPEGLPDSSAVQAILRWQKHTFRFMYKMIATTLKEARLKHHPQEYLNFYCLGNRETSQGAPPVPAGAKIKKMQKTLLQTRRTQIYVHSKLMIVDDETIIMGSANINERSQCGLRDSEIAAGYSQHGYRITDGEVPRGQAHAFRLSLWAEHLGVPVSPQWVEADKKETVAEVNRIAEANWRIYSQKQTQEMTGHLIPYPVRIKDDGDVTYRKKTGALFATQTSFPDYAKKAHVFGRRTLLPQLLTT